MILLAILKVWDLKTTFTKMRDKTVSSLVNEIALSGYTNSSQNIISGAHDLSDSCFGELVQYPCCTGFQFVFKDDKSDKVQSRFGFCALHLLNLDPVQFGNMFCCTCDDPKATMGIISKQLFIIAGNCTLISKRAQSYVGKDGFLQLSALHTSFIHSGAPLT
jgi:hypothetical protein